MDLRTKVQRLGAKEKARRKKCKVRFSVIQKNKAFQKNYMKVGVKKLLRAGMMPARTWRADTEEMKRWRSLNQIEMDLSWKKLAERMEEESWTSTKSKRGREVPPR